MMVWGCGRSVCPTALLPLHSPLVWSMPCSDLRKLFWPGDDPPEERPELITCSTIHHSSTDTSIENGTRVNIHFIYSFDPIVPLPNSDALVRKVSFISLLFRRRGDVYPAEQPCYYVWQPLRQYGSRLGALFLCSVDILWDSVGMLLSGWNFWHFTMLIFIVIHLKQGHGGHLNTHWIVNKTRKGRTRLKQTKKAKTCSMLDLNRSRLFMGCDCEEIHDERDN